MKIKQLLYKFKKMTKKVYINFLTLESLKKNASKVRVKYRNLIRTVYMKKKKLKLKNNDFSLISSNCNGACILHDLGLQFKSPFVNLWIKPDEFIKLMQSFKEYMSYDLTPVFEDGINYPIGLLKDIKIYFQHYHSFSEAKSKWDDRKLRINYNNLFVLMTDRDGCTEQDLINFDNLSYINKIVFVNKPMPNIKSSAYIQGFETEKSVGMCMEFTGEYSYKKYYDSFDYVSWFNNGNKS